MEKLVKSYDQLLIENKKLCNLFEKVINMIECKCYVNKKGINKYCARCNIQEDYLYLIYSQDL